MEPDRLINFRDRLVQMGEELDVADADTAEHRAPVALDQTSVGRLSRMDAMQQQAMAAAQSRRRSAMRQRIDAALKRIKEDEFGWCQNCGEAIAPRRLELDPTVSALRDLCRGDQPRVIFSPSKTSLPPFLPFLSLTTTSPPSNRASFSRFEDLGECHVLSCESLENRRALLTTRMGRLITLATRLLSRAAPLFGQLRFPGLSVGFLQCALAGGDFFCARLLLGGAAFLKLRQPLIV